MKLVTNRWFKKAGNKTDDGWYQIDLKRGNDTIKYKYYNGNTEWNFFAYKVVQSELYDWAGDAYYSTVTIKFAFERNSPYYILTLIIPIITLTLLAPIGLIIPGSSSKALQIEHYLQLNLAKSLVFKLRLC